jgi:hypothetical protein
MNGGGDSAHLRYRLFGKTESPQTTLSGEQLCHQERTGVAASLENPLTIKLLGASSTLVRLVESQALETGSFLTRGWMGIQIKTCNGLP